MLNRFLLWYETYRKRGAAKVPFYVWLHWAIFNKYPRIKNQRMKP